MSTMTNDAVTDRVDRAVAVYGLPEHTAQLALAGARVGAVHLVGLSGKLASGKDTVAPLVMDMLGARRREHMSFATVLKDEGDAILASIRSWAGLQCVSAPLLPVQRVDLGRYLATTHQIPFEKAVEFFAGDVADAAIGDVGLHARARTPVTRAFLQKLGTDVRRAQDDLYWVKRTVGPAAAAMATGTSVFFTDVRFPNEADAVRALGGTLIRLDVTEQTQRERLRARDGLELDVAAGAHPSETALDDYAGFDVRVSNDGPLEETLASIAAILGLDCKVPVLDVA